MSQLHTPDDLARSLREHADRIAPEPLGVADVRRRAAGIRRRRHGAALVAVVAGVALAVGGPIALTARNHDPIQPAAPTPTVTLPRSVPLDTASMSRGADPAIPYLMDGAAVLDGKPSGMTVIKAPGRADLVLAADCTACEGAAVTAFAPLGTGWVVSGTDGTGAGTIRQFDGTGAVERTTPSDNLSLGVSADGSEVAYSGQGRLSVLWDGGTRTLPVPDGQLPDPVGLVGTAPCVDPESEEGSGCTAYWNNGEGGAFYSSEHGITERIQGLEKLTGVAADGRISGQVSYTDDGSCSAVLDESLRQLWKTCDHSLGGFSPDGRYLVAYPAYRDGAGDTQVSILDSRTGRALVHFPALSGGFVYDLVWESTDDLIAVVRDDGSWHLLRLGVDGEVERAADPIQGDDYVAPVVLPARG